MDKVIGNGVVRVGVDLAKRVIQVHAVDANGRVLTSRALARDKFIERCVGLPAACIVAMEASSSAHHWARKLVSLGLEQPTNFLARREDEDALTGQTGSGQARAFPGWHSIGSDHVMGTEPR